jgi:ParB family chromosome partitioning protein
MERKALGKGISALIPAKEPESTKHEEVLSLKLEQIRPSPFQPRVDCDEQSMEELTQSIKEKGVIQPLLVIPPRRTMSSNAPIGSASCLGTLRPAH